ncbi:MAG: hypothetical protein ACI3YB_05840 [Prevotella sp.]
MRKFILLCLALAMCSSNPVNAQFLKKLGKALDKIGQTVDKINGGDNQIGNTVKIGNMTLTAYGDNPGVGFNYQGCYRKDGRVLFYFQLPSQGQKDVENIWIKNYEPNETVVYGSDGKKYNISLIVIGESRSSEGLSVNLPAGGFVNGVLVIDAPASAKTLSRVILNCTGQYHNDASTHNYRFVISNIPIEEMPKEEISDATYTKPAEGWMLTAEGVGPCKIGAKTSAMPAKVDGLYDKVEGDNEYKYVYLGEKHVMSLTCSSGVIVGIQLANETVGVKVGTKIFRIGGNADLLKKQSGVKGVTYNDDAVYNNIRFTGHDGEIESIAIGKQ